MKFLCALRGGALVAALIFTGGCSVGKIDEPAYQVVQKDGPIEIRAYEPMIIAQVSRSGERDKAISDGFRELADYIFGNNISKEKIEMTAPVTQKETDGKGGEKIEMTAPVTQQSSDDQQGKEWIVRFVMPKSYTLDALPMPVNKSVTIKALDSQKMAVIQFSGLAKDAVLKKNKDALLGWLAAHNLSATGPATYAFYNPPWTLPFMRRNEVMVEIE